MAAEDVVNVPEFRDRHIEVTEHSLSEISAVLAKILRRFDHDFFNVVGPPSVKPELVEVVMSWVEPIVDNVDGLTGAERVLAFKEILEVLITSTFHPRLEFFGIVQDSVVVGSAKACPELVRPRVEVFGFLPGLPCTGSRMVRWRREGVGDGRTIDDVKPYDEVGQRMTRDRLGDQLLVEFVIDEAKNGVVREGVVAAF